MRVGTSTTKKMKQASVMSAVRRVVSGSRALATLYDDGGLHCFSLMVGICIGSGF